MERSKSFFVTLLIALLMVVCGCSRKVYVPVENVSHIRDTVRMVNVRVDSVVSRDSVAVFVKGDTVRITRYRDRWRYRDRVDTVYKSLRDTVSVAVPVEVERKLNRWEQAKQDIGGFSILALIAVALTVVVSWVEKRKK